MVGGFAVTPEQETASAEARGQRVGHAEREGDRDTGVDRVPPHAQHLEPDGGGLRLGRDHHRALATNTGRGGRVRRRRGGRQQQGQDQAEAVPTSVLAGNNRARHPVLQQGRWKLPRGKNGCQNVGASGPAPSRKTELRAAIMGRYATKTDRPGTPRGGREAYGNSEFV